MPLEPLNDSTGSTLRNHVHNGPNQAGNKSLLSYRAGYGSPGYTGFIPGPQSIVLPVKNFQHTGRPTDVKTKELAAMSVLESKTKVSEYADQFKKDPSDTKPLDKTGGGYWFSQRQYKEGSPFIATTTYKAEILDGEATAAKQLERVDGLVCTIANYEAARKRSQSAEPSTRRSTTLPVRPATAVTSDGELVGYQTTTHSMLVKNPPNPLAAHQSTARPNTVPAELRYQVVPHAMPPGMFGISSSYGVDYGADASDPMQRSAPGERFQTRLATTRGLSEGTTRNTNHLPGYTGHMAASRYNELARAQADAADDRLDAKTNMLLYQLDQFSRSRVPHYTGYKPQAPCNITLEQPSQGPTTLTTSGTANMQGTRHGVPHVNRTFYNNSNVGLMSFFTSAGEYISDNGLSSAQLYYKAMRNVDGRFKMSQESKITSYGARFDPRSSMV